MMFSHRRAKNFLEQVGLGSSRQTLRKGVNSGLSLIQGKRCPWEIHTGNSKELWMTDFKQSVLPLPPVPGARSSRSPPPRRTGHCTREMRSSGRREHGVLRKVAGLWKSWRARFEGAA